MMRGCAAHLPHTVVIFFHLEVGGWYIQWKLNGIPVASFSVYISVSPCVSFREIPVFFLSYISSTLPPFFWVGRRNVPSILLTVVMRA